MDQPTPTPPTLPPTPSSTPSPVVVPVVHHSMLPWILLGLVLLVAVAAWAYLLGKHNATTPYLATAVPTVWPTPEPIVVPDPTASWTAYDTQNWSFKLPPPHDYFICNSNPDYLSTYIPGNDDMSLGVKNHMSECNFDFRGLFTISRHPDGYALPTTTAPDQNGIYTRVENMTNITVDGKIATQLEENRYGGQGEGKYIQVYVVHDNVTDNLTLNDVSQKATFDQFLTTIKFK